MSQEVRNLEPKELWNNFADLNAIPRASKKEEQVIRFMVDFGKELGLETYRDETGNVIIRKPGQLGLENKPVVAVQSHLDMVHQKNADTSFDFETEGIKMKVDGDWVKAEGTTLGADNGIGVAAIMTLLASKSIPHPPLEALFTIDEETGMTGAMGLQGNLLHAKYMLNLDTEDDRELTIGCAGGIDVTGTGSYKQKDAPREVKAYQLGIKGLTGGHSGMDIHLGRGNANKLMNRLLYGISKKCDLRIAEIDGGGLRNAIPRESFAVVTVPESQVSAFKACVEEQKNTFKAEYQTTDPDLTVTLTGTDMPSKVMKKSSQRNLLRALYALPNGIYRMSPDIEDLVQTSNNLARVQVKDGNFSVQCLTRSSVDSEKMDLAQGLEATLKLTGAKVKFTGSYPGWTPRPGSEIVRLMSDLYEKLYEEKADVNACHAGLECGILGTNYPAMEMISFGPNIRGAHSPDEKVAVSSVQKFWNFLLKTLENV